MASLVENIETWSVNKSDTKLFEIVKKQLKDKKTDINKLCKNLKGDADIAPLHAAVASASPEMFNLVLETEGVNPDPEYFLKGEPMGGILDFAVLRLNIDMVQLVLLKVKYSTLQTATYDGEEVATCLLAAVEFDRLDLVELLISHEEKYPELNPFHCLLHAIRLNKTNIFSKMLPKALTKINKQFGESNNTLIHKTVKYMKVKMLRLLVEAGCNVNLLDVFGFTPLSLAVILDGCRNCGDGCCEQIVSELLSSKSIDLDVAVKEEGIGDRKAIDYLNEKTCPPVRKLIEQAYSRDAFRKKLEKRKERASRVQPNEKDCSKSDRTVPSSDKTVPSSDKTVPSSDETVSTVKDENKICWSCSADPDQVTLFRCKGCKVAWYCREKCQEKDWPVHGPWCERKRSKREQKHKARAEEGLAKTRMPEVFYDLD